MTDEKSDAENKWAVAGVCVPACLLIGMGIGWIFGYMVQGTLIGLGAGFLCMVLVRLKSS